MLRVVVDKDSNVVDKLSEEADKQLQRLSLGPECSTTYVDVGYWDYSQDTEPQTPNFTKVFDSAIFDPETCFGGNCHYTTPTSGTNPYNLSGDTWEGRVKNGPFVPADFMLNFPTKDCLRRDFIPRVMNTWADPALVGNVLAQEDYTSFARAIENVPSSDQLNIHGSGHFGVGWALGTMGNAANSRGDSL
ncbi:uncharacterized protein M421DRAFT_10170 [Didymella exigua CBS 183.55]|uniref:Tyrosinase copper-binding domain-containing protein n=1 Tax=Didymella exigua CBS 183.55 TaxID=1150837 RepID=A0A6A5R407_9PLEO|nr:uncharacterized protein M421DRAFT_10170 [Didymella exigua CBS 183.55]KAF1922815.1 hypothetical protein M421DRAFT_10170 [Didymella exigua CBS 183.55]